MKRSNIKLILVMFVILIMFIIFYTMILTFKSSYPPFPYTPDSLRSIDDEALASYSSKEYFQDLTKNDINDLIYSNSSDDRSILENPWIEDISDTATGFNNISSGKGIESYNILPNIIYSSTSASINIDPSFKVLVKVMGYEKSDRDELLLKYLRTLFLNLHEYFREKNEYKNRIALSVQFPQTISEIGVIELEYYDRSWAANVKPWKISVLISEELETEDENTLIRKLSFSSFKYSEITLRSIFKDYISNASNIIAKGFINSIEFTNINFDKSNIRGIY